MPFARDVGVVGGCGRVGLPLALAFADRGRSVVAYDRNPTAVDTVRSGKMPFDEPGAGPVLDRALASGALTVTTEAEAISACEHVVIVVGTPVDEHLNPEAHVVPDSVEQLVEHLRDGQHLVLRSTVYPGVTRMVEQVIARSGKHIDVSFCPERIAESKALTELFELPQIVSGHEPRAVERASELFRSLTDDIVAVAPEEAELAKLFTNTWRYIKFAAANQFFMIANDFGQDFERIRQAIMHDYPRAADMPGAGFAAGPCLFKDTMQLAAFNNNNFMLGHASMMVNEGLPLYVVAKLEQRMELAGTTVGILGMAFKGESDDIRSSLSYKLKRILRFKAGRVLCHDPYVTVDPDLVPLEQVMEQADVLVIGTPHAAYRTIEPTQPVVDIWNVLGGGVRV
jgi:UDP-N-acetyl-D-mannosaminuronic acid dehydrogenase